MDLNVYIYCIAQFEDFDSPRPRLVRCVSCAVTTTGDFDVGAEAEAEAEMEEEGGAEDDASAVIDDSRKSSGTVETLE